MNWKKIEEIIRLKEENKIELGNDTSNVGTKKALIIGNTYKNSKGSYYQKITSSELDVNAMKNILEKKQFLVNIKIDLERKKLIKCIKDFVDSIEEGDTILFYYSGHGLSYEGYHLLIPSDFDGDERMIREESINFMSILEDIAPKKPLFKIYLFDCCWKSPFELSRKEKIEKFSSINSSQLGKNIVIASSTAESTISGIWTKYLTSELDKSEKVDLMSCFMNIRRYMEEDGYNEQIPWESSSLKQKLFI